MARRLARIDRGRPAPAREPRSRRPRRRKRQGRGGQQGQLTDPLTPRDVGRETRQATDLRFRPLERNAEAKQRASRRREREVGDWWGNYLTMVEGGRTDTTAAFAAAADTQQRLIGEAGARSSADTQRLQAEAAQSAALRGTAPGTEAASQETAAAAQRNYLAAAQGGALASQGAVARNYLTDQMRIGAGQSIASRREEQRRGRSIAEDRRALARERGDYASTYRGELRDKERDYLIQRGVLGLDKRQAAADAAQAAADRGLDKQGLREKERHNRETERQDREEERNAGKEGGLTPAQRQAKKRDWNDARSAARTLYEKRTWPSWEALTAAVMKQSEVSPAMARRAVRMIRERAEATEKRKRRREKRAQKGKIPSPTLPGATK